jgi:hypothetical protein
MLDSTMLFACSDTPASSVDRQNSGVEDNKPLGWEINGGILPTAVRPKNYFGSRLYSGLVSGHSSFQGRVRAVP